MPATAGDSSCLKEGLAVNKESLIRRQLELKSQVDAATAEHEAGTKTKAEYAELVEKAYTESKEIGESLDTYRKAAGMSGGAEVAIPAQPGLPAPQQERLEHAKGVAKEYAELKAFAKDKRQGSFAFDLGMKTQGEANLQGENAYGTTPGVALAPGEYFLPGTAGPDILPSFIPGILELRWYDNVIASLFPTFPTDSPVVSYVRETAWNNAAAATGEGQTFPTSTNQITRYTAQLGKVANITRTTDEAIQDAPYFWALVQKRTAQGVARQEEVQILAGSGYPGVEGLLGLSTQFTLPQTQSAVTNLTIPTLNTPGEGATSATISSVTPGRLIGTALATAPVIANGILAMLTDIRVTHFFEPTAIVMNPYDWFTIRTWQDNNGQYIAGSPFFTDYGQPQNNVRPDVQAVDPNAQIWGKRVAITPAIPQGYVLVGDFTNGAQLLRKGGLRVELVNTNGYDFEQGMWTMRAYTRVGLAVERPELFELAQLHA
jgi:HK97 family phage major capsid protein